MKLPHEVGTPSPNVQMVSIAKSEALLCFGGDTYPFIFVTRGRHIGKLVD